jgi:hypothetical protein
MANQYVNAMIGFKSYLQDNRYGVAGNLEFSQMHP